MLAKQGAAKERDDPLDLDILKEFDLQGARLISLSQATAYKGIKEQKPPKLRGQTERNIQLTAEAILDYTGSRETKATIWQGLRQATI
jgi:hypothetical protein